MAELIGVLIAMCPVVKYGYLYAKRLERRKYRALKQTENNLDKQLLITPDIRADLIWWLGAIPTVKRSVLPHKFNKVIYSDSSKTSSKMEKIKRKLMKIRRNIRRYFPLVHQVK